MLRDKSKVRCCADFHLLPVDEVEEHVLVDHDRLVMHELAVRVQLGPYCQAGALFLSRHCLPHVRYCDFLKDSMSLRLERLKCNSN